MNKQLKGFMDFVRNHGVVGLAVGLAIGTQVGKVVGDIVTGLIDPVVSFVVGNQDGLRNASWTIIEKSSSRPALEIGWGLILSSLITLLAVSAVIYYLVMGLRLDKVDKSK